MPEPSTAQGSTTAKQSGAPSLQQLIANYNRPAGRYDELLDARGQMRPHYATVLQQMTAGDDPALTARRRLAEGIIRKDGITYNVYGDPKGMDRPWALELLPVILTMSEWRSIEAGIRQRLKLINHLLADLHGPQQLVKQGVVPPEFVMANPRFLLPCHGIRPPRAGHVVRYAADLVRAPNGEWRVFSDRTQTPSGAGYALENRIVMARAFPNLIQDAYVQRLARFFEHFCAALRAADPMHRENPNIVMMTPGAMNETYFEHVYLARYLGYTLVEGEDLTVRDNRLYVRTVEGLEQADVVLRLVDDAFCDPLELRRDSILGPIGLLQALRSGNVSVCNAVGAGAAEIAALTAVMPRLARQLLGEDLRLQSATTYWGAIPEHRKIIDERLDQAPLYSAFVSRGSGQELWGERTDERRQRWRERPYDFVMNDDPPASTVPVLQDQSLAARSLVLRVYAVVNGDTGEIEVMPGGLARFSESGELPEITMQRGSGSKDVWVLADGPVDYRGLLSHAAAPVTLARSPSNLPSRMAENLLWLGRYCERTEHSVRFLRHLLARTAEEDWQHELDDIRRLVRASPDLLGKLGPLEPEPIEGSNAEQRAAQRAQVAAVQHAIIAAMKELKDPNGIASMVLAIRRALWIVRERFSEDDWRIVNEFSQTYLDRATTTWSLQGTLDAFNDLVTGFAAFSGLSRENMTREPGQFFLDIGRRVERSINTAELIHGCLVEPLENESTVLGSLLAVFDSPMTYRSRYGTNIQTAPVLDLLLCDETNPRAVSYQLARLARHLPWLPKSGADGLLTSEERVLERLRTELRTSDMFSVARVDASGRRSGLEALWEVLREQLPMFADLVSQRYFIHTEAAQQLGMPQPSDVPEQAGTAEHQVMVQHQGIGQQQSMSQQPGLMAEHDI